MNIDAKTVKELRDRTGVGMMAAKEALVECQGDMEKAVDLLRKKGLAKANQLAGREAKAGRVGAYLHFNGTVGTLVEMNCETDFVANTDDFQNLLKDIAMHIAFAKPSFVTREQIPADVVEREKAIYVDQVKGKPPEMAEKILTGKLEKSLYETRCLVDQVFCNEEKFKGKVGDMIKAVIGKIKENIVVKRFAWFHIGQGGGASL